MASPFSHHYYQGGYDYEFLEELPNSYECPICLLCTRDPYQTSCGHRFCHSCILTWLQEGRTCPKDSSSLGEGDIFPDAIAHRQILQLIVHCPLASEGCKLTVRLSDVERHVESCTFRQNLLLKVKTRDETCKSCGDVIADIPPPTFHPRESGEASSKYSGAQHQHKLVCPKELVACAFAGAGCSDLIPRGDLSQHMLLQTNHHLQLLYENMLKLQQIQNASSQIDSVAHSLEDRRGSQSPVLASLQDQGPLDRGDVLRLSGSNLHNTQKLIKDLYHRMITLEQKMRHLEISNERLAKKIEVESKVKSPPEPELIGRFCNGEFVWRINRFSEFHDRMRHNHAFILYSDVFYTSVFGYKFCLRCNINISKGEEHLGLFVHLMQGDNDDCLQWPFAGKIVLKILNKDDCENFRRRDDFCEIMTTPTGPSEAFLQPREELNKIGFGLQHFIRINSLYSGGFVSDTDCVTIKACVVTESELSRLVEDRFRQHEEEILKLSQNSPGGKV